MIEVEKFPCNDGNEARASEEYWISFNSQLHVVRAYTTDVQRLEQMKQYNVNNKVKYLEYHKQYYKTNKENRLEYQKTYYENNKDKKLEYQRSYNNNNKKKQLVQVIVQPKVSVMSFCSSCSRSRCFSGSVYESCIKSGICCC